MTRLSRKWDSAVVVMGAFSEKLDLPQKCVIHDIH